MSHITVKGSGDDNKVILWEKSPEHPTSDSNPEGEVWIANDGKAHTVGETRAVKRLLMEGRLVNWNSRVTEPAKPAAKPAGDK